MPMIVGVPPRGCPAIAQSSPDLSIDKFFPASGQQFRRYPWDSIWRNIHSYLEATIWSA